MVDTCINPGKLSRLQLDDTSYQFEMVKHETQNDIIDLNDSVITGQLDPVIENVTNGIRKVRFTVDLQVPVPVVPTLLALVFAQNSNVFTTHDATPTAFDAYLDYYVGVHHYTGCVINRISLTGQAGNRALTFRVEIIGKIEAELETHEFPTLTTGVGYVFSHNDTSCTLEGSARQFDSMMLMWDRRLIVQYNSSQTAQCIKAGGSMAVLATSHPYVATSFYFTARDRDGGHAGTLVFKRLGKTMTITSTFKAITRPPDIDLGETRYQNWMRAYGVKATNTPMLTITITDTV